MTLKDFENGNTTNYLCDLISKEKFWFENQKVSFWYRIGLLKHEYQPSWGGEYWTRYQVMLLVDDESLDKTINPSDYMFPTQRGFFLKENEKRGHFNKETMEKILNSALKIKIENKIKMNNNQKITGILNGSDYYD